MTRKRLSMNSRLRKAGRPTRTASMQNTRNHLAKHFRARRKRGTITNLPTLNRYKEIHGIKSGYKLTKAHRKAISEGLRAYHKSKGHGKGLTGCHRSKTRRHPRKSRR